MGSDERGIQSSSMAGENVAEAYEALNGKGGVVVSPTKVGYIIVCTDKAGLERKFDMKERKRNKPGVVLCGSMEQLKELAQLSDEATALYQKHWDEDILLGCILPWKESGKKYIPDDGFPALERREEAAPG